MSSKVYSLSRDQVREICPSCADKMQLARIKELKLTADELGNVLPENETMLKLFAGFSQGLCDKFGTDEGFFTRCAETMAGKEGIDDEKSFCAALHKHCVGKWPAEKDHALHEGEDMKAMLAKLRKEHPDATEEELKGMHDAMMAKMKATKNSADDEHVKAYSNFIKGVEIFSSGTHNGDEYTEQDLDDIVGAFKELDYQPAIKIGHTKDTPGAPSYGWVKNLRRLGNKLYADFTDMHDSVVDAIRKRAYNNISSEIYFNLKRGGKDYRRALKAVALLGAEVPAVANLVPLHKMQFAEATSVSAYEQALDVPSQSMVDVLAERVAGLVTLIKEYDMAKNAEQIKALKAQVDDFGKKMSEMKKKKGKMEDEDMMEDEEYKQLAAQADEISDKIAELEAADDDHTGASDAAVAELQEQLEEAKAANAESQKQIKALSERTAIIEKERREREVGDHVKACQIPAFREGLSSLYAYALEHSAATIKVYSKDKDGKPTAADKTLVEVVDGMVGQINAQSEKLFKALAYSGQKVREDGVVVEDAGQEINKRVTKYRTEHPTVKTYEEAMVAVLAADPELDQRWRDGLGRAQ